jgi:serine beta-lactamase-like protein LACTB, mitochondrial
MRSRMNCATTCAVPLLIALRVAFGQSPAVTSTPNDSTAFQAAIAKSRAFIRDTMRVLGAPGASVCVARDNRIVWSEEFGLADVEEQVRATPLTEFRVGSVSKALTSAALGLLIQEGRLDLDAPVQRYVPSFPVKRWPITTRQLAGHLAGIRHYRLGEFESQKRYRNVLDGLSIFATDTLLFRPGTKFSYSSYGWNLISAVIEGATGEPFTVFMRRRIFEPLGMDHTVGDDPDSIIPLRARPYVHHDSTTPVVINAPYVDDTYKWASGGFLSTAEDLCHFGEGLLLGRLLRPETVRLLWTSQTTVDGKSTGYGLGWYLVRDTDSNRIVFHTGGAEGSSALLAVYPDDTLVLAVLVNSDRTFIEGTGRIARWFLGR